MLRRVREASQRVSTGGFIGLPLLCLSFFRALPRSSPSVLLPGDTGSCKARQQQESFAGRHAWCPWTGGLGRAGPHINHAAMIKKIIFFLAKVLVCYVALIVLLLDLMLLETAVPRYMFERQPFIQSAALAMAVAAALSIVLRSWRSIVFAAVCVGYSGFVFVYTEYVALFIAVCGLLAAISFLFRNKITEPLLILLPVIAGAWTFLSLVYTPYFVGWAYYASGNKEFVASVVEVLRTARDQVIPTLVLFPVLIMYFLGKQIHVKLLPAFLRVFSWLPRSPS